MKKNLKKKKGKGWHKQSPEHRKARLKGLRKGRNPKSTTGVYYVRFFGDDIVFQFSRTGGGSRVRKTRVFGIRKATDEEIKEIREIGYNSWDKRLRRGKRTRKRGFPVLGMGIPTHVYIGQTYFRFEGESKRWVKVWGESHNAGVLPDKWESYGH